MDEKRILFQHGQKNSCRKSKYIFDSSAASYKDAEGTRNFLRYKRRLEA